jgi:hypothetical protein
MQKTMCQKDTSGNYCASSFIASMRAALDRRDTQQSLNSGRKPVESEIRRIPRHQSQLSCGLRTNFVSLACAKLWCQHHSTWQLAIYPGLQSSQLLASEPGLYTAIDAKCPSSFLSSQVRLVQHHGRPMVALRLLARRLLPPPLVPLHFCGGESFSSWID